VVSDVKEKEALGASFEAAEASVELMLRRKRSDYRAPFVLEEYRVLVAQGGGAEPRVEATIKLRVGEQRVHTAAEGQGPVHALDAALRKALEPTYPEVRKIQLVDYTVRILDGRSGTRATTRVRIDSTDGTRRWATVGASGNILEASWQALADSVEYGLSLRGAERVDKDVSNSLREIQQSTEGAV
jgi:2-isopropylmalate synthase